LILLYKYALKNADVKLNPQFQLPASDYDDFSESQPVPSASNNKFDLGIEQKVMSKQFR